MTRMPMTPARRAILAVGVPLVLALVAGAGFDALALADEVSYHVHRSFAAGPGPVTVAADNASLTVRPAAAARIEVSGTLQASLARPVFTPRATPAGVDLHTRCRIPTGYCTDNLAVTVPRHRDVRLSASTGDLHASGFSGHVTLSDGSGDIGVSRLTGTISLTGYSGDIAGSGLGGGDVSLSDSTGDISVAGVAGQSLRLSGGTGDMSVTGVTAADVTGRDGSGDITITFTKAPRRVDIHAGSGDVSLVLPRGPASYQVQAYSQAGDTTVSVPRSTSAAHVILVSAGSGDVRIT